MGIKNALAETESVRSQPCGFVKVKISLGPFEPNLMQYAQGPKPGLWSYTNLLNIGHVT